jgi:hypothetical protein
MEVCHKNSCKTVDMSYEGRNFRLSSYQAELQANTERVERIDQFKKKYAKEIAEGQIKETYPGSFDIVDPTQRSAKQNKAIQEEIRSLFSGGKATYDRMTAPHLSSERPSPPNLYNVANGIVGLMDCCHDTTCQRSLLDAGVNLVPQKDSKVVK